MQYPYYWQYYWAKKPSRECNNSRMMMEIIKSSNWQRNTYRFKKLTRTVKNIYEQFTSFAWDPVNAEIYSAVVTTILKSERNAQNDKQKNV